MSDAKQKSLGDGIFERILLRIQSGEFPPGLVLNESALAAEFGVSRGPVREAIRRLQGIQLVSRESYLKARVTTLTPQAVVELFQMREALEGYACRLAAERMAETEIASLAEDLDRSRQGGEPPDFHARIVRASGNERIIEALCGDLYHLLRAYRRQSGSTGGRRPLAYREHWEILRAIRARDPDLAESLMRSHIARAMHHLAAERPGSAPVTRETAAARPD
jgi:DNA-binding GntR family transcriptional regulator